jgi:hypothetical protein
MKNQILKSNSAFILIGDAPSWKTTAETGRLFSLVQNYSFDINLNRQKLKQIGRQNYAINNILQSPDVNLNIDYYLSPYLNNEFLLGFGGKGSLPYTLTSDNTFLDNNFYLLINSEENIDGLVQARKKTSIDFSGFDAFSFGNCYLTKYSLSFQKNSIPLVSTSYVGSNVKVDKLNASSITIPAINLQSGNANSAGTLNLANTYYPILSGFIDVGDDSNLYIDNYVSPVDFDISTLPVVHPHSCSFLLQNLQVGGIRLSSGNSPILQSMNIDINFPRINSYGLGSNYVFDRKLSYPIDGQVKFDCLVSGFNSGILSGLLNQESGYDFDIAFSNRNGLKATGYYLFRDAKLDSFNYSMSVNQIMTFSASFSVAITDTTGFFIKRDIKDSPYLDSVQYSAL